MKRSLHWALAAMLFSPLISTTTARAQAPATDAAASSSQAQQAVAQASAQGKFSFIVFYREDNDLTRAMAQVVTAKTTARPDFAVATFVQITDPANAQLVKQFSVARAPMPLTLVTAPNGAVTGGFPQRVAEQQLDSAFVTPAMSHCIKSMQAGKIVFLCLQTTLDVKVSQGVAHFLSDPQYKDRATIVTARWDDPAEAELLKELKIGVQPGQADTAFFAPPGVLVGVFGPAVTKTELATALKKAGQCCEDPNCKHNHAAKPGASVR